MEKLKQLLAVAVDKVTDGLEIIIAAVVVVVLFKQEYQQAVTGKELQIVLILLAIIIVVILSPFISEKKYFRRLYILVFAHIGWVSMLLLTDASGAYVAGVNIGFIVATSLWLDFTAIIVSTLLLTSVLSITSANISPRQNLIMIGTQLLLGLFLLHKRTKEKSFERNRASKLAEALIERERLRSLINSMADGVIATDEAGHVVLYNGAALDILNVNASLEHKLLNKFLKLIDSSDKPVDIFDKAKHAKAYFVSRDYRLDIGDGEMVNVFTSIAPVRIGFGKQGQQGFILLLRDITREKSLEEERDEFISVVSHELRTPIAIAEGNISNAQLLLNKRKKSFSKAARNALDDAYKQVVFLSEMINDLSTLSRAERGVLHVEPESIDPVELAQSLERDYHIEAEQKGLSFVLKVDEDAPHIISSRLYVREILQNFLTNAIKYTEKGTVTLKLKKVDDHRISYRVSDSGIGISQSDQRKLFDKFFRSEDFRTRAHSGTGLGLYVTLKLAKLIHAEISVESKIGVGSSFTVEIPTLQKHHPQPKK